MEIHRLSSPPPPSFAAEQNAMLNQKMGKWNSGKWKNGKKQSETVKAKGRPQEEKRKAGDPDRQ